MDFRRYLILSQDIFRPEFQQSGLGQLNMLDAWDSSDVNAEAWPERVTTSPGHQEIIRNVRVYGGLARHPLMSGDGLLLVICHEIGHHLGGYPRKTEPGGLWASTEGQSDYYATAKCARQLFARLGGNEEFVQRNFVPAEVRRACTVAYPDRTRQAVCMRSAMAGLTLGRVLASLRGPASPVDFRTIDRTVVDVTDEYHPAAQCRLDTYFAGSLCQADPRMPFSGVEPRQGACTADQRFQFGFRPRCWFKDPRPTSLAHL